MAALADVGLHPAARRRMQGWWSGLVTGLTVNVVIFALLFATPWADDHVPTGVALGALYAGPAVVALVGLVRVFTRPTRRHGWGLVLAAPMTVGLWFLWFYVDGLVALSSNTPGP